MSNQPNELPKITDAEVDEMVAKRLADAALERRIQERLDAYDYGLTDLQKQVCDATGVSYKVYAERLAEIRAIRGRK